jgi:hypothetical protein
VKGEKAGKSEEKAVVESKTLDEKTEKKEDSDKPKKKSFWAKKSAAYMKGFPFRTRDDEINNFLADLSDVKGFERMKEVDGQWSGSIVVKFKGEEGLDQALNLDGSIWNGTGADGSRYIKVEKHDAQKQKKRSAKNAKGTGGGVTNTVFFGNMAPTTTQKDIEALISEQMGTTKFKTRLALDENKKLCRGFGHVEFDKVEDKERVLKMSLFLPSAEGEEQRKLKIRAPSTPEKRKERDKKAKNKEKKEKKKTMITEKKKAAVANAPKGFKRAPSLKNVGAGGASKGKKRGGKKHRTASEAPKKRQKKDGAA